MMPFGIPGGFSKLLTEQQYKQSEFPHPSSEEIFIKTIFDNILKEEFLKVENDLKFRLVRRGQEVIRIETAYEMNRVIEEKVERITRDERLFEEIIEIYGGIGGLDRTSINFLIQNKGEVGDIMIARARAEQAAARLAIMIIDFLKPEKQVEVLDSIDEQDSFYNFFRDPKILDSVLGKEKISIFEVIDFLGQILHGLEPNFKHWDKVAKRVLKLLDDYGQDEVDIKAFKAFCGKDGRGQWFIPKNGVRDPRGVGNSVVRQLWRGYGGNGGQGTIHR